MRRGLQPYTGNWQVATLRRRLPWTAAGVAAARTCTCATGCTLARVPHTESAREAALCVCLRIHNEDQPPPPIGCPVRYCPLPSLCNHTMVPCPRPPPPTLCIRSARAASPAAPPPPPPPPSPIPHRGHTPLVQGIKWKAVLSCRPWHAHACAEQCRMIIGGKAATPLYLLDGWQGAATWQHALTCLRECV